LFGRGINFRGAIARGYVPGFITLTVKLCEKFVFLNCVVVQFFKLFTKDIIIIYKI